MTGATAQDGLPLPAEAAPASAASDIPAPHPQEEMKMADVRGHPM